LNKKRNFLDMFDRNVSNELLKIMDMNGK